MRRVDYSCAMSLDGYIAGPDGEYDWIPTDPDIDFEALYSRFDTFLMGRKTYEIMRRMGGDGRARAGARNIVFSHTLRQDEHPLVTISTDPVSVVKDLRGAPGKDIWLFGGGELCRSLLEAGLVDGVEVAVLPVLLGGGIPLIAAPSPRTVLKLRSQRLYEKSGIVLLEYDVVNA